MARINLHKSLFKWPWNNKGIAAFLTKLNEHDTVLDAIEAGTGIADALRGTAIAVIADGNLTSGVEVVHVLPIPDAATADIDFVLVEKVEIIDVIVRKSAAGAGNTIQLKTGAGTAITDAIAAAVDKAITRAGTIDPATATIAAGGTLRVTATRAAGSMLAQVVVRCIKRA
jgi:hypothetical protein